MGTRKIEPVIVKDEEFDVDKTLERLYMDLGKSIYDLREIRRIYGTIDPWELLDEGVSPSEYWQYWKIRRTLRKLGVDII